MENKSGADGAGIVQVQPNTNKTETLPHGESERKSLADEVIGNNERNGYELNLCSRQDMV